MKYKLSANIAIFHVTCKRTGEKFLQVLQESARICMSDEPALPHQPHQDVCAGGNQDGRQRTYRPASNIHLELLPFRELLFDRHRNGHAVTSRRPQAVIACLVAVYLALKRKVVFSGVPAVTIADNQPLLYLAPLVLDDHHAVMDSNAVTDVHDPPFHEAVPDVYAVLPRHVDGVRAHRLKGYVCPVRTSAQQCDDEHGRTEGGRVHERPHLLFIFLFFHVHFTFNVKHCLLCFPSARLYPTCTHRAVFDFSMIIWS